MPKQSDSNSYCVFAAESVEYIVDNFHQDKSHPEMPNASMSQFGTPRIILGFSDSLADVTLSFMGRKKLFSGVIGFGLLYDISGIIAGVNNS